MTTTATTITSTVAPTAVPAPLSEWRFERDPRVRAIVTTIPGRLLLVALFTVLMRVTRFDAWWQTAFFLSLLSILPQQRKVIVTAAAICWIFIFPPLLNSPVGNPNLFAQLAAARGVEHWLKFWPIGVAVVWFFGLAYTWFVRKYPDSIIGRRPVMGLMLLLLSLLIVQDYLNGPAWFCVVIFAVIFGQYIWYFCYAVNDAIALDGTKREIQPGFWRPFWNINKMPLGKGAAYLERAEAKNDEELATAQLKGLKLLWWATVLSIVRVIAENLVYGPAAESMTRIPFYSNPPGIIPQYRTVLEAHLAGSPFPLHIRWLTVIAEFLFTILYISIWGHKVIAVARMAGYNVLRNTYRPLESTTIAEFYNRFHYYLKEFLATFFFFPTYLRYFKKHPRLRLFMATVAAAGAGNLLYHFVHYDRQILQHGFWQALWMYNHFFAYGAILGTAIGLSQIRNQRRRKPPTGWRKYRAIAGVLLFYCLMTMFNETFFHVSAADYGSFFLSLWWP